MPILQQVLILCVQFSTEGAQQCVVQMVIVCSTMEYCNNSRSKISFSIPIHFSSMALAQLVQEHQKCMTRILQIFCKNSWLLLEYFQWRKMLLGPQSELHLTYYLEWILNLEFGENWLSVGVPKNYFQWIWWNIFKGSFYFQFLLLKLNNIWLSCQILCINIVESSVSLQLRIKIIFGSVCWIVTTVTEMGCILLLF